MKRIKLAAFVVICALGGMIAMTTAQQQGSLEALREKARNAQAAAKQALGGKNTRTIGAMKPVTGTVRLKQVQARQARDLGIHGSAKSNAKKAASGGEEEVTDRFVQSEAHVYSAEIRQLIQSNFNIIPHLDVIATCVVREEEHSKTHDVFYHALNNEWLLTQDLDKQLYAATKSPNQKTMSGEFVPLRASIGESVTARDYLINQFATRGNIDDTLPSNKGFLLSTNLALFGSVGWRFECTWNYFMAPSSREPFDKKYIEAILNKYNFSPKYADELVALVDILRRSKTESLVQIFIPRALVDEIAYVAWVKGIPAHQKTIKWAMDVTRKQNDPRWAINKLTEMFKDEQQQNPLFKETIQLINEGKFGVRELLGAYRNKPWEVDNLNLLQARLIITKEILLNPTSGVKFYRYSTLDAKDVDEYRIKLNAIVDRMVREGTQKQNNSTAQPKTTGPKIKTRGSE